MRQMWQRCWMSENLEGEKFFTRLADGRRAITPLFLVLLVIESSDVLFAFDSIPAVFGVTQSPFIVFTSNIFAILNLRYRAAILQRNIAPTKKSAKTEPLRLSLRHVEQGRQQLPRITPCVVISKEF